MKEQVKGAFKSFFFHQKEKQKADNIWMKFFLTPDVSVQQVPQPPYSAHLQIISQVRINKMVNKQC